jgi:aspartyl-tRNA(Asn)/glutamyl-tRNA(Gln) amidotransferase subunit C
MGYIDDRMPRVTPDVVDHVARLARLSLTEEERKTFARQLDEVLAYAESIQSLDVSDVSPMSRVGSSEALRDDAFREGLSREAALAAAPDPADRLFRVPRIIGG